MLVIAMMEHFVEKTEAGSVPITPLSPEFLPEWRCRQPDSLQAWIYATNFSADKGTICLVPAADGSLGSVLVGVARAPDLWSLAGLPQALPPGDYRLDSSFPPLDADKAALGWALGGYRFTRYVAPLNVLARLVWPRCCDRDWVENVAESINLVRDLINTPAEAMGPAELAEAATTLARANQAEIRVLAGDALVAENFPAVHAVGRASSREPRLIDMCWGSGEAPKVTLVGKGVCFDSGGLDLKPARGMILMKKDMGGGALVLGLARLIMAAGLRVRLRVLVPAVENSVAGNAMRPLDVIESRKGLTIEVGNTDAEGRLILADALAEADREKPDLLIDCATLTGAARVALGPDVPAMFTPDDTLAEELAVHAGAEADPLWRLPLWAPYREMLASKVADLNNVADGPFAGAITAALFLKEFVTEARRWVHLDMMAWNAKARPGRPVGGEAMGLRALFALIRARYGA